MLMNQVSLPFQQFLLLVSTLDGTFFGVDRNTGHVQWFVHDEPLLRVELDTLHGVALLPDPKTGAIYKLDKNGHIRKLPFSISDIIKESPYRGDDGKLYTGAKRDLWISMDLLTGSKLETLSADKTRLNSCPAYQSGSVVYIGKTEYIISIFDGQTHAKLWNVSFVEYSGGRTPSAPPEDSYPLLHFAASETGRLVTLDKNGDLKWQFNCSSPVIDVFYIGSSSGLHRLPLVSVTDQLIDGLSRVSDSSSKRDLMNLIYRSGRQSLCLSKYVHGVYAMPMLVDDKFLNSFSHNEIGGLLLPGPMTTPQVGTSDGLQIGIDYPAREISILDIIGSMKPLQTDLSPVVIGYHLEVGGYVPLPGPATNCSDESLFFPNCSRRPVDTDVSLALLWTSLIGAGTFCCMVVVLYRHLRRRHHATDLERAKKGLVAANRHEMTNGSIVVGKIVYDSSQIIGHGCEGTFVYRGWFETRNVAVKRLLKGCFSVVDREVEILRSSEQHPNVIRYFSMEMDQEFYYLALELCVATLEDALMTKPSIADELSKWVRSNKLPILRQATDGVAHLHRFNICHRDLKPHNVLLTCEANDQRRYRAVISDFGLCKRLTDGKMSFSKRSGATGTDGWIAPELYRDGVRITCSVDVFSLGCVFYYVLTDGLHPFGTQLHRQANILAGRFSLNALLFSSQLICAKRLVGQMLSAHPQDRPLAADVLDHPYFWSDERQLNFLLDTSDRVDKLPFDSPLVQLIERNGVVVIRGDWHKHVTDDLLEDLMKFRSYKGSSVRDLLRALRNKRHHYDELSDGLQKSLGSVANGDYVRYFTGRFPLLLWHSYSAFVSSSPLPSANAPPPTIAAPITSAS